MSAAAAGPVFCARCAAVLTPGRGDFYQVTIEAVADPASPILDLPGPGALRDRIEALLAELAAVSEREALAQVHQRLLLHLCRPCFARWIENPVAG